ncbi:MAG: hypothetical protein IJX98_00625 [Clostridia bacterium]|nr:hypothetical protein [Clostridia bacterium]
MNKFWHKAISIALGSTMLVGFLAGCAPETQTQKGDPEKDPLVFALGQPDGNFNPFFSTSAVDVEVLGMTQVGMMTTDESGNLVCGEDEATVALAYNVIDGVTLPGKTEKGTEYQFLIKNDMKFSNGTPLTIKDVLFNLYVYLDPAYAGSATIYSTDIYGLKEYRTQDWQTGTGDENATYTAEANARMQNIVNYCAGGNNKPTDTETIKQVLKDIYLVMDTFYEEISTDWNNLMGADVEEDYPEYSFTEVWQAYYLNEGLVTITTETNQANGNKVPVKDANGKYVTDLTETSALWREMEAALEDSVRLQQAQSKYNCSEEDAKNYVMRDTAIAAVYKTYCGDYTYGEAYDETKAAGYAIPGVGQILQMFSVTPSTVRDAFVVDLRQKYFDSLTAKDKVPYIKGITTKKVTSFETEDGKTLSLDGEHDVLSIRINGVDPKAIYNFSFGVAPLYYYSSSNYDGVDYVNDFNGHLIDYTALETAMGSSVASWGQTVANYMAENDFDSFNFGVAFHNDGFFGKDVLKNASKNRLPVGAGPYMASNSEQNPATVTGDNFYNNNIVYYERNPYFETLGSGIENAKIKYFKYAVTADKLIVSALEESEVHYGQPNATELNRNRIDTIAHLGHKEYDAAGYGYVGINPKAVPDLGVRRAIMLAFNKRTIFNYYGPTSGLCSLIDRPMSVTSWAYPFKEENKSLVSQDTTYTWGTVLSKVGLTGYANNETAGYGKKLELAELDEQITDLVKAEGYTLQNVGGKQLFVKDGKTLKYKFTIAGATDDHPAANMFKDAADYLNSLGFEITVGPDVNALNKLATGDLEVWAAAWSSALDPDMYQVYHKNSTATSVNNWGYDTILNDTTGNFDFEKAVIEKLSEKIDEARKVTLQAQRTRLYKDALDLVMELSVEFPTYQRKDMAVFNKDVIDTSTLNLDNPSYNAGVVNKVWEINFN